MPKAFLSHSSLDKTNYTDYIAQKLGPSKCVYDAMTFESGLKSIDEIFKGFEKSDIFVIFISQNSLKSKWVQKELSEAHKRLNNEQLKQIYPIIIDKTIKHDDTKIPKWLQQYNIKLVEQPSLAFKRIETQLRIICWEKHPEIKKRDTIFVGRNDILEKIESRIDDIDKSPPVCIIASGLKYTGRSYAVTRGLIKANCIEEYYKPENIEIHNHESIEDFIIKIMNLGFSKRKNLNGMLSKTIDEKISLAISLIDDIVASKEILLIHDDGCIVKNDRSITEWFTRIVNHYKHSKATLFCIASTYRPHERNIDQEIMYVIEIPVLPVKDRMGIFKRYLEAIKCDLSPEDIAFFKDIFSGYPNQIFFTADMIQTEKLNYVKNNTDILVHYSHDKANYITEFYSSKPGYIDVLVGLCQFEFLSYDMLKEIFSDYNNIDEIVSNYYANSIIEYLDRSFVYLKINDIVRDSIRRSNIEIPKNIKTNLIAHTDEFLRTYLTTDKDLPDILFSIQNAIQQGKRVDQQYLIPSQYLKAIVSLYDIEQKYDEVVQLADHVLLNEKYIDAEIKYEIQYYLCMALARQKNDRIFKEVVLLRDETEGHFIKGFYYRITGQSAKALDEFKFVLTQRPNHSRAKREMVQVLFSLEDFPSAYLLAKENYENNKNNSYQIHAYIICLIYQPDSDNSLIEKLINDLYKSIQRQARQQYYQAQAEYLTIKQSKPNEALALLNAALKENSNMIYVKLLRLKILEKMRNYAEMKKQIENLRDIDRNSQHYNEIKRREALYYAHIGEKKAAENIITLQMNNYPKVNSESLLTYIRNM